MDPELAALTAMSPRLDISDVQSARAISQGLQAALVATEVDEEWAELVDWADGPLALEDGRSIPARVYRPVMRNELSPGLVFFHGGGFVMGDLEQEHSRCTRLAAEATCIVVSVDYRLAPEHPFPEPFDDCYLALKAVVSAAKELEINATRLAVGGSSAGAGLAAAVALKARDEGGPEIAFQLLIYPALDDRMSTPSMLHLTEAPGWDARQCRLMWGHYLGGHPTSVSPYAAPARASDVSGLPPAYIMTAELDPLRDEGITYAMRLAQAGVSTELHLFAEAFHGFDLAVSSAEISRRALGEQAYALRVALRP